MIDAHLTQWLGLPVEEFQNGVSQPDAGVIYRIGYDYEDESYTTAELASFLNHADIGVIRGLILGLPGEPGDNHFTESYRLLAEAAPRMTNLKGLFLGDILQEESEMSWIEQSDITPILSSFTKLETLFVRGSSGLVLKPCSNPSLKSLVLESGGMPAEVLHALAECSFPELEHLEIWLGDEGYGWNGAVTDVMAILRPGLFPKLKSLGLRNSEIANDLASVLSDAPLLDQLDELDLSLGTMTDEGAAILLQSPKIRVLKKLNLNHNYLTAATLTQLAVLGPETDLGEQQSPSTYKGEVSYYVAVGE